MAGIAIASLSYHEGEVRMHDRLRVPTSERDNPTVSALSPGAGYLLSTSPLLAVGAVDSEGRPWTTIWGGTPGFARDIGGSNIALKVPVDAEHDPVVHALLGDFAEGQLAQEGFQGRMMSALAIDLEKRKRVKLFGRTMMGTIGKIDGDGGKNIQLITNIEQSLGNCPKYISIKEVETRRISPELISSTTKLSQEGIDLLAKSDVFYVSSRHNNEDMDTNHRGGPPGFVRVLSNDESGAVLVWPEYSGNRLYQTLGNLEATPLAGLVFPSDEGDVLYVTGKTEILVGEQASALMPRANVVVKLSVTAARFVKEGLGFTSTRHELSPYNPQVRLLASESKHAIPSSGEAQTTQTARLLSKTVLTPSIARFRFALTNASSRTWRAGQWVALDFSRELGSGYSHMRDEDPRSLNDDYVRTFTISSPPPGERLDTARAVSDAEFEITIRRIDGGPVTGWLFRLDPQKRPVPVEIPVIGIGGDNVLSNDKKLGFVAAGVGITPLLASARILDPGRLSLLWALRGADVNLALDFLDTYPALASSTTIFLTGDGDPEHLKRLEGFVSTASVFMQQRRLQRDDVRALLDGGSVEEWHVCSSAPLRKQIMEWLPEVEGIKFEDFSY